MATSRNKGDACVRCKAQKQGAPICRNTRHHVVPEYPGTPLSQSICGTLLSFRTTLYPQADLLRDQQLLEQALRAGGSNSAIAAMNKLKGEALTQPEAFDVDGEPAHAGTSGDDLERD